MDIKELPEQIDTSTYSMSSLIILEIFAPFCFSFYFVHSIYGRPIELVIQSFIELRTRYYGIPLLPSVNGCFRALL